MINKWSVEKSVLDSDIIGVCPICFVSIARWELDMGIVQLDDCSEHVHTKCYVSHGHTKPSTMLYRWIIAIVVTACIVRYFWYMVR